MPLDTTKLSRAAAAVDLLSARLQFIEWERNPPPVRVVRADWDESQHPRGPDGKFVAGSGAAAAAAAEYLANAAKAGKKPTPNGMMQHLLMNGGIPNKEIWEAAQANFEMKPGLNNYVTAVYAALLKGGKNPPPMTGSKKKGGDKPSGSEAMAAPGTKEAPEAAFTAGGGAGQESTPLQQTTMASLLTELDYATTKGEYEQVEKLASAYAAEGKITATQHEAVQAELKKAMAGVGPDAETKSAAVAEIEEKIGEVTASPLSLEWAIDDIAKAESYGTITQAEANELTAKAEAAHKAAKAGGAPGGEAPPSKEVAAWEKNIANTTELSDLTMHAEDIDFSVQKNLIAPQESAALKDKIAAKAKELKAAAQQGTAGSAAAAPEPTKLTDLTGEAAILGDQLVSAGWSGDKMALGKATLAIENAIKNKTVTAAEGAVLSSALNAALEKAYPNLHVGAAAQPAAPAAPASPKLPPVVKSLPAATSALATMPGLSPSAKAKLLDMNNHWDKVLPDNKAPIEAAMLAIEKAAQEGPAEYVAALKAQPELSGGGLAKQAFNESLAALKAAAGIKAPAPASGVPKGSSYTPKTPVQTAIFDSYKDAPKQKYTEISEMENHAGQTVEAKLVRNLKEIPGNYHALVASAVGGPPPNGMAPEVDQAMASYQDYVRSKTPLDQLQAMQSYKGSGYTAMNQALLSGSASGHTAKQIEQVRAAINSNVCPSDLPVFRGMRCSLKDLSGFDDPAQAVGRCFEHKNFASVSRSPQTAEAFGQDTMMEFTLKAGTPAYPLPWASETESKGHYGGERELVLADRSMFRIDKVIEEQHPGKPPGTKRHRVFVTYLGVPA